jgi:serine/threonine protein kinase
MSEVHLAWDKATGREVAVKLFHPAAEVSDQKRARREVAILASLDHPGLVELVDAQLNDNAGRTYLVTEFVPGPTLAEAIARKPLSEAQVRRLGGALCEALAYVHGRGLVHRDVKPANVVLPSLDDDGYAHPKLVDFGIALALDGTRVTEPGLAIGTANYLSPEQVTSTALTPACDIYALGLVLLEALTGTPAYPGVGIPAAVCRLNRPPTIPSTVTTQLADLLCRMTANDPDERPTAAQAAAALAMTGAESDASARMMLPDVRWWRPLRRPHRQSVLRRPARRTSIAAASVATMATVTVISLLATVDHGRHLSSSVGGTAQLDVGKVGAAALGVASPPPQSRKQHLARPTAPRLSHAHASPSPVAGVHVIDVKTQHRAGHSEAPAKPVPGSQPHRNGPAKTHGHGKGRKPPHGKPN